MTAPASAIVFEPLAGWLVAPERGLWLGTGRWNPESRGNGGSQSIMLEWDPDTRHENLWRPQTEPELRRLALLYPGGFFDHPGTGLPTPRPDFAERFGADLIANTVNRSPRSRTVFDCLVDIDREAGRLVLQMTFSAGPVGWSPTDLRNAGLSPDAGEAIAAAVRAIPALPEWVRMGFSPEHVELRP